jgi:transposase
MGRKVQYGVLGRVKHHLGNSEYAMDVKRFCATTKVCSKCGIVKPEKLGLDVRTFECEECGAKLDRDVNAAINIKLLGQHNRLESGIDFGKRDNPLTSDSSDVKIA